MIKQKINLYRAQIDSDPDLSFLRMIAICGAFFIILLIYSGILWETDKNKVKNIQKLQDAQIVLEKQFLTKNTDFNVEDKKNKIQAEIDKITNERDRKKIFLNTLKSQGLDQQQGFSRFLDGLSQNHVEGTWFSSITIQGGGSRVALSGHAVRVKLIPEIFQELSKSASYQGKFFDKIIIQGNSGVVDPKKAVPGVKANKSQVNFEAKTEGMK